MEIIGKNELNLTDEKEDMTKNITKNKMYISVNNISNNRSNSNRIKCEIVITTLLTKENLKKKYDLDDLAKKFVKCN